MASNLTLPPIAVPGVSLEDVDTPALLLDLNAFERNLDRMQAAANAAGTGVALRPHAKAHKTPAVALAQIARGAVGICCQKVSEALPFIAAGVRDIHISNQPALSANGARTLLLARAAHHARMSVCVDDARQIDALGAATAQECSRIGVFVEIDIGQGRCGVPDADGVLRLLERLAAHPQLEFRGLQAYHGGLQHIRSHDMRRTQSQRAAERTGAVLAALGHHGVRCATVTGGGTGSVEFDLQSGVFTEVQPGSYAFMDRDYGDSEYDDRSGALRFDHALFLATTVMSTAAGGHVVVDAGLKSLATDSGLPGIWQAAHLRYDQANDEHGIVTGRDDAKPLPALGSRLHLVPGHCDPTFNLHDALVGFRGDTVESVWPIAARGLSR
ncbi:DSD1 family PLP-dependent enzyme [Variovorax sp. RHLX14]|uniref:DSD1 family PLP-dependent enzyme n=1 Tax=Variovorax sp. RHLX14 TaxID=1259731 RepID=UPI003F45B932